MSTVSLQARQEFLEYCQQNPSAGSCSKWEVISRYIPAIFVIFGVWLLYALIIAPKGKLIEKIRANFDILLVIGGGILLITNVTEYGLALMAIGFLLSHLSEGKKAK
jgi:hypothetical protein